MINYTKRSIFYDIGIEAFRCEFAFEYAIPAPFGAVSDSYLVLQISLFCKLQIY